MPNNFLCVKHLPFLTCEKPLFVFLPLYHKIITKVSLFDFFQPHLVFSCLFSRNVCHWAQHHLIIITLVILMCYTKDPAILTLTLFLISCSLFLCSVGLSDDVGMWTSINVVRTSSLPLPFPSRYAGVRREDEALRSVGWGSKKKERAPNRTDLETGERMGKGQRIDHRGPL